MVQQAVTSTTQSTVIDRSSSGPGILIWLSWDPASNGNGYVWLDIDGTEIITNEYGQPSGRNYMVGKVWEGADSGTSEQLSHCFDVCFFKTGFAVDAKCASSIWTDCQVNAYWFELNWTTIS